MRRRIPVGKDGYVPVSALIRRFHEKGSFSDLKRSGRKILPSRLRPEDAEEWWDDPGVCDIDGIDTADSPYYSVPLSINGRKRAALSKIAVIAEDRKESDRIKKILSESFTSDELEMMASGESLIVEIEDELPDCTGFYVRKQKKNPVPKIVVEKGTTADGIVHEAVHHLRTVDGRTAFPTKNRTLEPRYVRLPKSEKDEIFSKEESETVAETVARTAVDPVESGYYSDIPGYDARRAYLYDQDIISGSRALKGKAAIKAAQENYDRTSISRAIISSNKKPARRKK